MKIIGNPFLIAFLLADILVTRNVMAERLLPMLPSHAENSRAVVTPPASNRRDIHLRAFNEKLGVSADAHTLHWLDFGIALSRIADEEVDRVKLDMKSPEKGPELNKALVSLVESVNHLTWNCDEQMNALIDKLQQEPTSAILMYGFIKRINLGSFSSLEVCLQKRARANLDKAFSKSLGGTTACYNPRAIRTALAETKNKLSTDLFPAFERALMTSSFGVEGIFLPTPSDSSWLARVDQSKQDAFKNQVQRPVREAFESYLQEKIEEHHLACQQAFTEDEKE